ncbi:HEPN domain-containing protein [Paludisphaera rhizosphaerae]|uniref:DNA-binding protein n=1 Tax=Paludisphaera rhizosphaerae TaxID=2711216 RepID=UPI0013EBFC83|nr:DNA-binding protein [Paludisphaera rhizosphaerae]
MNRSDLQQLAEDRVLGAEALLSAARWSGAYYLAGYAIECALKACIARRTKEFDFYDPEIAKKVFTHHLPTLLNLAKLEKQLEQDSQMIIAGSSGLLLTENWSALKDWNERKRYEQTVEAVAHAIYDAVADPVAGVLPWIKQYW